ncbi:MAG: glycosyltransferase [Halobacteriota archaeon]
METPARIKLMLIVENFAPDIDVSALRMGELVNAISRHQEADCRIVVYKLEQASKTKRVVTRIANNASAVRYEFKYLPQLLGKIAISNPLSLLLTTLIATREVRDYKPDLILTTVPTYTPSIAAYLVSLLLRKRHCIDVRDDWISQRVGKWAIRELPRYKRFFTTLTFRVSNALFIRACKRAFLLSAVYEEHRKDLQKLTNFDKPVVRVPNGINLSELKAVEQTYNKPALLSKYGIPVEEGYKYVIYAGTISGYHKPEVFVAPLQRLLSEGKKICYIIAGGGDPCALNKEMRTARVEKNVFLLGKITHTETLKLLLAGDAAFYAFSKAYPDLAALSVKILEYVACRLPILAIIDERVSAARFIEEHGIGIVRGWEDLSDMAMSFERLLQDPRYTANIDAYYPDFIREFERSTNSERWYRALVENYQSASR